MGWCGKKRQKLSTEPLRTWIFVQTGCSSIHWTSVKALKESLSTSNFKQVLMKHLNHTAVKWRRSNQSIRTNQLLRSFAAVNWRLWWGGQSTITSGGMLMITCYMVSIVGCCIITALSLQHVSCIFHQLLKVWTVYHWLLWCNHTQQLPFNDTLSGTSRVRWNQDRCEPVLIINQPLSASSIYYDL